jgi:hypothetical protein
MKDPEEEEIRARAEKTRQLLRQGCQIAELKTIRFTKLLLALHPVMGALMKNFPPPQKKYRILDFKILF